MDTISVTPYVPLATAILNLTVVLLPHLFKKTN
jgi:hypothetical protein